jgi:hypothetical protein
VEQAPAPDCDVCQLQVVASGCKEPVVCEWVVSHGYATPHGKWMPNVEKVCHECGKPVSVKVKGGGM